MRIAGGVFAKGRDPHFEPWQDVLQLNASSSARSSAATTKEANAALARQGRYHAVAGNLRVKA